MKRISLFLPVLVALFLAVSLYAANAARLGWSELIAPLIMSLIVGFFFMGIFALHPRTAKSMPLIASVFTLAVLLWYVITPYVGVVLLLLVVIIARRKKVATKQVETVWSVLMIGAIAFSALWGLVVNVFNSASVSYDPPYFNSWSGTGNLNDASHWSEKPNIYFIVPDRMPSPEAMRESGIDPSELVAAMSRLDFYVSDNQKSADAYIASQTYSDVHTTRTMRFFASVLNMGKPVDLSVPYKECRHLITHPAIIDVLHENGYSFVNIASWFAETAKIDADISYHFPNITLNEKMLSGELAETFWGRTIFKGETFQKLLPQATKNAVERNRQVWQAAKIVEVAAGKSQFVLAHILLPHEPFAWTADGKPQTDTSLSIPEQYYEQIRFTADYITRLAEDLRRADPAATIIFQADEGMCYARPRELSFALTDTQWRGVFTAWYIPGADESELSKIQHTEILKEVAR